MLENRRNRLTRRAALAAPLMIAFAFVSLTPGCGKDDVSGPENQPLAPTATLVSHTACKSSGDLAASLSIPVSAAAAMDCVEYRVQGGDTLFLEHVNAAFNCCPGELTADVTISNDTIRIVERESAAQCLCLCLYDLTLRIDNLRAGTYTFEFAEPYASGTDEPLAFTANLAAVPSDTFCVERSDYPWNTGGESGPVGVLVSRTDCHGEALALSADGVPTDMSCIEWRYGADEVLALTHVNAAFNCCPGEITADITIANGTITIVEHEEQSLCDCSCLYDLHFEITGLESGTYAVRIVEPYVRPEDKRLEFSIDLAANPAGAACAYRANYPWLYSSTIDVDKAALDGMRAKIIDFIGTPSCDGGADCRYIGAGAKPCGGPWEYLIYSIETVDEDSLEFDVSLYNELYRGFNRRYNLGSTCDVPARPDLGCVEGLCTDLKGK
jgi:hypothetical protein